MPLLETVTVTDSIGDAILKSVTGTSLWLVIPRCQCKNGGEGLWDFHNLMLIRFCLFEFVFTVLLSLNRFVFSYRYS